MVRKFFCFLLLILTFSNICYAGVSIDIISAPLSASAGENLQITINIYSDVYAEGHLYSISINMIKLKIKQFMLTKKGGRKTDVGLVLMEVRKKF